MDGQIELYGDRIRLRTTAEADRAPLIAIRSTPEVHRRWRGEDLDAEFSDDLREEEGHRLTIETSHDGRIIGLIQFYEEDDPDYRSASIDIYIDPAVHRRGYGSEAIRTLAGYLFDQLGHHRLTIDPAADNTPAIDCYAGVGFRPVGIMRRYERQAEGSWADGLLMDMLVEDR